MQLPAWLDVALEGGVVQLQRALGNYVGLRALLRGEWQRRALSVAERCDELMRFEPCVEAALLRARGRARLEKRARAVLPLVERVERERDRLHLELQALCAEPSRTLETALRRASENAREQAWFEEAWRSFHLERSLYVGLMLIGLAALPTASWLHASMLGFIPTVIDLRELGDSATFWGVLLTLSALTAHAWRRLSAWRFLGVRRPTLVGPGILAGLAAVISVLLRLPFAASVALTTLCGLTPLALANAVMAWRPARNAAAPLPGDAPAPPALVASETSQPAAATAVAARARVG